MLVGASHIDRVDVLRSSATASVLAHRVMAPSTLGTFLRAFSVGHVRKLDAVIAEALRRALGARGGTGCGPDGDGPRLDHLRALRKAKRGVSYGYAHRLSYHLLVATWAAIDEVFDARLHKGGANSQRGALRFVWDPQVDDTTRG